jgi:hypothetical protein
MSEQGSGGSQSSFAKAFVPGLILGLVVGALAGAFLSDFLTRPPALNPTNKSPSTTREREGPATTTNPTTTPATTPAATPPAAPATTDPNKPVIPNGPVNPNGPADPNAPKTTPPALGSAPGSAPK